MFTETLCPQRWLHRRGEIRMSDSENERKPDSEEGPSVMTPETLRESLGELAKNVDDLVDRLTMDMTDSPVDENRSKQPAVPPSAPDTQAAASKTPPSAPVQGEPPPAAAFSPDEPVEAPPRSSAAADEDMVAADSIDEDLEIMGLAEDVIDSMAGTEADSAEAAAPPAESAEPEAPAELPDPAKISVADQIDAELAKNADRMVDSDIESEVDEFLAQATPVEPQEIEDTATSPEEVASPVDPEASALEPHDADAVTEPLEALDLDVQNEIDAIDAGLDSLLVQDDVKTDAETEENETLKLADGPQAESVAPGIKLAAGRAPIGEPDKAPAVGQTSRLKKPSRADVLPWSTTSSPRHHGRGMSRTGRLVAAMLFLGAVCGGAWVLLSKEEPPTIDFQLGASGGADRNSGDATTRTAGSAIPFVPGGPGDGPAQGDSQLPAETTVALSETPPAPETPAEASQAAAPVPEKRAPSPPQAKAPKPTVAKTPPPPAKQPSNKIVTRSTPPPPPVKKATKPAKTAPKTTATTPASDTPKVADARPVAAPVTAPKPPPPEQPTAPVTTHSAPPTVDETPTGTRSAAPTGAVAPNVDRDPPAPTKQPEPTPPAPAPRNGAAAGPTGPAKPAADLSPPQLLTRQEPIYPPRARKRGEGGIVELKVLVNEQGRVVRVVVEQGLPGSELEARAIDAALRSTYRPATEAGQPVRAWVTERFVFEP
jgi:TonB family protein